MNQETLIVVLLVAVVVLLLVLIMRQESVALLRYQLEEARRVAVRDHLTGLYTRAFFDAEFNRLLCQLSSAGTGKRDDSTVFSLSVLFIDIDRFKGINDNYGHQVGDIVLKKVARSIERTVRAGAADVLARYGGEELVVLLPNHPNPGEVAERIRRAVEETVIDVPQGTISVTVSVGVATTFGESGADVLEAADRAMYRAKKSGRNQVIVVTKAEGEAKKTPNLKAV